MRGLAALFLLLSAGVAFGQSAPKISLLTFSPGDIYWQRFGHNGLIVKEPGQTPLLYNYGVFDFQQKNFFLNFARGRMLYQLDARPLAEALYPYSLENRWAFEQELALNDAQARQLAEFLRWNARPENAEYRYEYFTQNCSTRVRDALDKILDGQLRAQLEAQAAGRSLRFEATRLIAPHRGLMLAMDLALGPLADAPLNVWQQSFVPMTLMSALREVRLHDAAGERPLIAAERWLLSAQRTPPPEAPPSFQLLFGLLGLAAAGAVVALRPYRSTAVLSGVLGFCGVILSLGWFGTEHWAMRENLNVLLLNPLWLLLIPSFWRHAVQTDPKQWPRWLAMSLALGAVLAGLLFALPQAPQLNGQWLALLLPLNLALAWLLQRRATTA